MSVHRRDINLQCQLMMKDILQSAKNKSRQVWNKAYVEYTVFLTAWIPEKKPHVILGDEYANMRMKCFGR